MYTYGGELTHYGILGMHWGVRRYQPYSQGYQAKGKGGKYVGDKSKKRERDPHANMTYNEKRKRWEHNDYRRAHNQEEYKKKHYEMSDKEIKSRVDRIKNEQKYVDEYEETTLNKGKKFLKKALGVATTLTTVYTIWNKIKKVKGKQGDMMTDMMINQQIQQQQIQQQQIDEQNRIATQEALRTASLSINPMNPFLFGKNKQGGNVKDNFNTKKDSNGINHGSAKRRITYERHYKYHP